MLLKSVIKNKMCASSVWCGITFWNQCGTKAKLLAEMSKELLSAVENDAFRPKQHPGILKARTSEVPLKVQKAAEAILKDQPLKIVQHEGEALSRYLRARHLPLDQEDMKQRMFDIQKAVELEYGIDSSSLDESERELTVQKFKNKVQERLKRKTYAWQPISYDQYKSLQYLVGRSAAEYSILTRIFTELHKRVPDFKPQSLFDFGSGVGTASWAARALWESSIIEYFNVDTSADMNELASLLLRDGNMNKPVPKGVYYRQFLPASHNVTFDIVVSAFSLFELPSSKSRLETVLNLWNKTQDYLVLVELGSKAGFKVINEARDFILQISENAKAGDSQPPAHVFSPCPHDSQCPRSSSSTLPCCFQSSYFPMLCERHGGVRRERYTYVVLKKGARPVADPQWARIISPVLVRTKHSICRLCLSDAQLGEVIFSPAKHGKILYQCARASQWGDLLPVTVQYNMEKT